MYRLITLSPDEEQAALILYKETKNKQAKENLIFNSLRYLLKFINKFPKEYRQDLINEACCAICVALEKTNVNYNCKFSSYAYMTAKKYICLYLNNNLAKDVINVHSIEKFEQDITTSNDENDYFDLYEAINKLEPNLKEIIIDRYYNEKLPNECATSLNIHRNTYRRKEQEILTELRSILD